MKWFKHDSDASNDAKLRRLRHKYGAEGYAIYWYCLELIARNVDEHNLTFELEHDADLIAEDFRMSSEVVQEMMAYMVNLGLFENSHGVITCMKMLTRTDEYTRKLIAQQRQSAPCTTLSGQTPDTLRTKSELIEEKRREETTTTPRKRGKVDGRFDTFWSDYPKKASKGQAEKAFIKINPDDDLLAEILAGIARAKRTDKWRKDAGQFIPNPATWLNARGWEDECAETSDSPILSLEMQQFFAGMNK